MIEDHNWLDQIDHYISEHTDRLLTLTSKLVQIPSANTPPYGSESACQTWLSKQLTDCGLETDLYTLDQVSGLSEHPLYFGGRNYLDRPNLAARRRGQGKGRTLLLSGHIDTVPKGSGHWTYPPFSGRIEGNRLYGRGSNDMKAGIAMNLFAMECLVNLSVPLGGDVVFESVIDEEFGGCNGTLAGRLRGHNADAAILTEASALRVCPAQRGGRTAHLLFRTPPVGALDSANPFPNGAVSQLTYFLSQLPSFAEQRTSQTVRHSLYLGSDPVPVSVTKVFTAPWGFREPITTPETAQVELYWQMMPGEQQSDVEREFYKWLRQIVAAQPKLFPVEPEVTFPIRWLPGSAISVHEPLVEELSSAASEVLGRTPSVAGIEGPCDLFIFQQGFGIPAVIWGPAGGNTHGADEYVEVDSLVLATRTLLRFLVRWCGLSTN